MKSRIITGFRISCGCFRREVAALRMFLLLFVVFIVVRITLISFFPYFIHMFSLRVGLYLPNSSQMASTKHLGFIKKRFTGMWVKIFDNRRSL